MSFPTTIAPLNPAPKSHSVKFNDPAPIEKKAGKKKFLKRGEGAKYDPKKAIVEQRNKKKVMAEEEFRIREEVREQLEAEERARIKKELEEEMKLKSEIALEEQEEEERNKLQEERNR